MKNLIRGLFSKEKININRQYELDLLRGFTLIILIVCHVGLYLSIDKTSGLYYFCDIIGSEPGAPVFMVLMGISLIFTKHQKPSDYLKRGLILFIGSYLLNLARSFPYWITGELDFFACVRGFFVVDIFQLAGLTFLLFALFKAIKMPSWGVFLVSIVFLITGRILMAFPESLKFPEGATYVLNLFLPLDNDWCCFNLLTWFIYPCFGIMIGELLSRCKKKETFYLILLCIGSIGVITLYTIIGLRFPTYVTYYTGGNFYRMGIFNTFITLLVACFLLGLWFYIGKVLPKFIFRYLSFLSKNVTVFYVFSWLIISPIMHIQAFYKIEFSFLTLIGMMIGVLVICSLLVIPYRIIKRKYTKCIQYNK